MINSVLDGEKVTNVKGYPKLMIANDGEIVLMEEEGIGMVVHETNGSSASHEVSYRTNTWHMTNFKDYNGSVTLSNK